MSGASRRVPLALEAVLQRLRRLRRTRRPTAEYPWQFACAGPEMPVAAVWSRARAAVAHRVAGETSSLRRPCRLGSDPRRTGFGRRTPRAESRSTTASAAEHSHHLLSWWACRRWIGTEAAERHPHATAHRLPRRLGVKSKAGALRVRPGTGWYSPSPAWTWLFLVR